MARLCYHDSENKVKRACKKIFANMLRERAKIYGGKLFIRPKDSDEEIVADSATDDELKDIPLLGYKRGKINRLGGYTRRWDVAKQCVDDPAMYFAEIPDVEDWKKGVSCKTAEYSDAWVPDVDLESN